MLALFRNLDSVFALARQFGTRTIWHTLAYRLQYWYWQRVYRRSPTRAAPVFLGDLLQWEPSSPGENGPRGIDLRCRNGVLRVEFLDAGIVRVRLSRDGSFTSIQSFALQPGWQSGQLVAPIQVHEDAAEGDGARLHIAGPELAVVVARHPCRLTFVGGDGQVLYSDADGAGWQGRGVMCTQRLAEGQALYGLGEKAFGLQHRGRRLALWNRDPSGYGPGTDPLYQSIPFLLSQRDGGAFGILFDNTYRAEFDLGQEEDSKLCYRAAGGELCYYVLAGPAPAQVLARYADLTGHMALPPRWALGFHQSRWSYASADEVRRVAAELRGRRIPCDAIYFDIDYMDGYRVFTWNKSRFPDPPGLIAELRDQGLRAVTIQDPGVKADPGYQVCAEGLAQDAFCRLPDGRLLAGPVWPGQCYFPDFSNAGVRSWWGAYYADLLAAGVAGFWNDMNEPAVFFAATFPDAVQHRADAGPADHAALHNVYGQLMAQAGHEALRRLQPDERPLLITRAAYAGIQRYACTWTGDNQSTWDDLRLSIPMVLNLGLSGQPFAGPDTGGFSGDCTAELLARWTELSCLLPLFRNHTALGTAHQEPWAFGEPCETICRRYIELRYRLLPYIYTAFWQAADAGLPVVRPLALTFPQDPEVAGLDDQFMCGDSLLVAPVVMRGAGEREVYFPAGAWYDFWTGERLVGPLRRRVSAPLEALPLYVRGGSAIPLGPVMQYTDESVPDQLELHIFAGDGESVLYEDDGHSYAYQEGSRRVTHFSVHSEPGRIVVERQMSGVYDPGYRGYDVLLCAGTPITGNQRVRAHIDGSTQDLHDIGAIASPAGWRISAGDFRQLSLEY